MPFSACARPARRSRSNAVAWWVELTPQVVRGLESFGFKKPSAADILEMVDFNLGNCGDTIAMQRWKPCPDDYFVYSHVFVEDRRLHTLEFIVDATSAPAGVLKVVWVEQLCRWSSVVDVETATLRLMTAFS